MGDPDDGGPDSDGLPESIELAWGLRERPGRGPRRTLTLAQVVAAGISVAGTEGLTAVSMSRVAAELGVGTMSLYRYVPTKRDLLDLMVDTAYGPPPAPRAPDEDWRPALTRWATANLDAIRRQPWIRHVPVDSAPLTPQSVAWMEHGLVALRGTGLRGSERIATIMLVSGYVRSWAALTADLDRAAAQSGLSVQDAGMRYWRQLERVTRDGPYPAIRELLAEEQTDDGDADEDAEWRFGLDRLLDGIQALVHERTGRRVRRAGPATERRGR